MSDINDMVITEMVAIQIRKAGDHEVGPNAKVEARNLGWPPPDKKEPTEDASKPDHMDPKLAVKLPDEKPNLDTPSNLASGEPAGDRLRKAIQAKQKQEK